MLSECRRRHSMQFGQIWWISKSVRFLFSVDRNEEVASSDATSRHLRMPHSSASY